MNGASWVISADSGPGLPSGTGGFLPRMQAQGGQLCLTRGNQALQPQGLTFPQ